MQRPSKVTDILPPPPPPLPPHSIRMRFVKQRPFKLISRVRFKLGGQSTEKASLIRGGFHSELYTTGIAYSS